MRSLFKLFPLVVLAVLCRLTAEAAQPDWECNARDYQYNMTVYASLVIDGQTVTPADYMLAAFCGDQCRGVATVQSAENHNYYYLRVRSNQTDGETISLRVYDPATDHVYDSSSILTSFEFVNLEAVGYPSQPVEIDCRNTYEVAVLSDEHGTITGAGSYLWGTEAILSAEANEGYEFAGWSNGANDNPLTIVVRESVRIGAEFTPRHYTVTWVIDDEPVNVAEIAYGQPILEPEAPEREGYTFSGWSEHPQTMPAQDLVITGEYTINSYRLTYMIDDEVIYETEVEYGTPIEDIEAPEREGYTFGGWSEHPQTMPARDLTITGQYTINRYRLTYMIDDEVFYEAEVEYGAPVVDIEVPEREHYTFSGWSSHPQTMPAQDVVITGRYVYSLGSYHLYYVIDGELFYETVVEEGSEITDPEAPEREGYTFGGWSRHPETMPAEDLTITGRYTIDSYILAFMIDDEIYELTIVDYGAPVEEVSAPEREGYSFSWSEHPDTMPAHDLYITGTYTVNSYRLTYMIDDEVLYETQVEYGSPIEDIEAPEREHYTFSGWSEHPQTMPAGDLVITGTYVYTLGAYRLTYIIDGGVYYESVVEEGSEISDVEAPERVGYTFSGWSEHPLTMPAEDLVITGSYSVNRYRLTYMIDDEVYHEAEVEYGARIEDVEAPEREGYTFCGWSEHPQTMPAEDVVITGSYTPIALEACLAPVISYNGRYVTITCDTPEAVIYYTTDGSLPTDTATVYTAEFDSHGICMITAIATKPEYAPSMPALYDMPAYYDGETAVCAVPDRLSVAFGWTDTAEIESLTVEGQIGNEDFYLLRSFESLKYLAIKARALGIPDEALAGTHLVHVEMPGAAMNVGSSLFAGCEQLGAITWNTYSQVPAAAYDGLADRNTIVYTADRNNVPADLTNVVVGDVAEQIVLADDRGPVYVPREFLAKNISYSRTFGQTTPIHGCAGWESLSLPFDVQTVTHEREGVITSFADGRRAYKHYWLYGVAEKGFAADSLIKANTPYVISMPNNPEYNAGYCLNGVVMFSSTDCTVSVTESAPRHIDYTAEGVTGRYNAWPTMVAVAESEDVYALNSYQEVDGHAAGSVYVRGLRGVKPFEAYVTAEPSAARVRVLDLARMLGDEDPSGITGVGVDALWSVSAYDGTLYISSGRECTVNIVDLSGRLVKSLGVGAGVTPVNGLATGLYIVNGIKVVVK